MTRVTVATLVICSAIVAPGGGMQARQQEDYASLEKEAALALSPESEFSRRADLADRLQAASQRAPDAEQRARLALLFLRAQRSLIAMLPFERPPASPYREWLAQDQNVVVHREIGGWVVPSEFLWRVHDTHKGAGTAESIAWFIVETGMPSDCEGYIPCYMGVMNAVNGEFLRRYPRGVHASDAVAGVHSTVTHALESLSEPFAKDFLDSSSSRDCEDLKHGLQPLRQAIANSNAESRAATLKAIDNLLGRCP